MLYVDTAYFFSLMLSVKFPFAGHSKWELDMKTPSGKDRILEALIAEIQLPDSAYDKAVKRYEDLGVWLNRDVSTIKQYSPRISPQGSFALGTATYPLNTKEDYDLDLTCKLQDGVTRDSHTQFQVKDAVRHELEQYRLARNIHEDLQEKRRCWRLIYKDSPGFHLDTVPSIPVDQPRRSVLIQEIRSQGMPEHLLDEVAGHAIWITDNRHPAYRVHSSNWLSSNPSGYVRWFQSRLMGPALLIEAQAKVDDMPIYRRKTPLQQSIQLLKRHRDVMFERFPASKPISAIITTIAARNYSAGESLAQTMATILNALDTFRRSNSGEVLNPVNPKENFADKWAMPEYAVHNLKQSFYDWVEQVVADFTRYMQATSATELSSDSARGLKITPNSEKVALALGAGNAASLPTKAPRIEVREPPKPWRDN